MTALRGEDLVRQSFNELRIKLLLSFNASYRSNSGKARDDWRRKKMFIRLLSGLPEYQRSWHTSLKSSLDSIDI